MTISEVIAVLQRFEDEHGDVPVETQQGIEVFAVSAVFGPHTKGMDVQAGDTPPVVAVSFR